MQNLKKCDKRSFSQPEIIAKVKIKFRFAYGTPPVWESPFLPLSHTGDDLL
jgi:hypothetical protein